MSARKGTSRPAREASGPRPRAREPESDDQQLNDQINALLRDAAAEREERTLEAAARDAEAARRQFDAVVELSRRRAREDRR